MLTQQLHSNTFHVQKDSVARRILQGESAGRIEKANHSGESDRKDFIVILRLQMASVRYTLYIHTLHMCINWWIKVVD